MFIVAAHQIAAGCAEYFHVVDFGAGLVEALAEILPTKADEVYRRRGADANHLILLKLARPAGVVGHMDFIDFFHKALPPSGESGLNGLCRGHRRSRLRLARE